MRISHEAIYQALYIQGCGALKRELTGCLRTGRALRVPHARSTGRGKPFVSPEIMISERPAEAADRAVPGHMGRGSDPRPEQFGHRHAGRADHTLHLASSSAAHGWAWNEPAPEERTHAGRARRRGGSRCHSKQHHRTPEPSSQVACHGIRAHRWRDTRISRSSRGYRSAFVTRTALGNAARARTPAALSGSTSRSTNLNTHSPDDPEAVVVALNGRPRKTLGWRTPAETLDELMMMAQDGGVATTGGDRPVHVLRPDRPAETGQDQDLPSRACHHAQPGNGWTAKSDTWTPSLSNPCGGRGRMNASTCMPGKPALKPAPGSDAGSHSTPTNDPTPPIAVTRPPWAASRPLKPISRCRP